MGARVLPTGDPGRFWERYSDAVLRHHPRARGGGQLAHAAIVRLHDEARRFRGRAVGSS